MNAKQLAISLSNLFLSEGKFDSTPIHAGGGGMAAAANTDVDFLQALSSESGFSGLSVQAVGYESSDEGDAVHVYVSSGNIRQIPDEIAGIKVRSSKMSSLRINPQLTAKATNRGQLFINQNGRIACGSSCAPSGQNYSGTFGALLTDGSRIYALSNNHVFSACNHVPAGMPILSPSTQDSHPHLPAPREIGRHAMINAIKLSHFVWRMEAMNSHTDDPFFNAIWLSHNVI